MPGRAAHGERARQAEEQRQAAIRNLRLQREAEYVDDDRSFVTSTFRKLYDRLKKGERVDRTVMETVKALVFAYHGKRARYIDLPSLTYAHAQPLPHLNPARLTPRR